MNADKINKALEILKNDDACIFPTDTVYGLFCRALSPRAASRVYRIKGRSKKKPLQLFLADKKDIFRYTTATPALKRKISGLLPGPYTVILKLNREYRTRFSFLKTGTAGFRVIKSSLINGILKKLDEPLAATSANISGNRSPRKFSEIEAIVMRGVRMAVKDDKKVKGKPSKVLDFTGKKEKVLRA
jgi:L-threonylcarbamoyladenylate synthase